MPKEAQMQSIETKLSDDRQPLLTEVDLNKIDFSNPYRVSCVDDKMLLGMRANISKVGLRNEIELTPAQDGQYRIISGYTRALAFLKNWRQVHTPNELNENEVISDLDSDKYSKWSRVPAKIKRPSDEYEELELAAAENLIRADMNPVDLLDLMIKMKAAYERKYPRTQHGKATKDEYEEQPAFTDYIARIVGKSTSWVKTILQLNMLDGDLKEVVRKTPKKRSWAEDEQKIRDGIDSKFIHEFRTLIYSDSTSKEDIEKIEQKRTEIIEACADMWGLDKDLKDKVIKDPAKLSAARKEQRERSLDQDLLARVKDKKDKFTIDDAIKEQKSRNERRAKEEAESDSLTKSDEQANSNQQTQPDCSSENNDDISNSKDNQTPEKTQREPESDSLKSSEESTKMNVRDGHEEVPSDTTEDHAPTKPKQRPALAVACDRLRDAIELTEYIKLDASVNEDIKEFCALVMKLNSIVRDFTMEVADE
jgi:hypothetical protein